MCRTYRHLNTAVFIIIEKGGGGTAAALISIGLLVSLSCIDRENCPRHGNLLLYHVSYCHTVYQPEIVKTSKIVFVTKVKDCQDANPGLPNTESCRNWNLGFRDCEASVSGAFYSYAVLIVIFQ